MQKRRRTPPTGPPDCCSLLEGLLACLLSGPALHGVAGGIEEHWAGWSLVQTAGERHRKMRAQRRRGWREGGAKMGGRKGRRCGVAESPTGKIPRRGRRNGRSPALRRRRALSLSTDSSGDLPQRLRPHDDAFFSALAKPYVFSLSAFYYYDYLFSPPLRLVLRGLRCVATGHGRCISHWTHTTARWPARLRFRHGHSMTCSRTHNRHKQRRQHES